MWVWICIDLLANHRYYTPYCWENESQHLYYHNYTEIDWVFFFQIQNVDIDFEFQTYQPFGRYVVQQCTIQSILWPIFNWNLTNTINMLKDVEFEVLMQFQINNKTSQLWAVNQGLLSIQVYKQSRRLFFLSIKCCLPIIFIVKL